MKLRNLKGLVRNVKQSCVKEPSTNTYYDENCAMVMLIIMTILIVLLLGLLWRYCGEEGRTITVRLQNKVRSSTREQGRSPEAEEDPG